MDAISLASGERIGLFEGHDRGGCRFRDRGGGCCFQDWGGRPMREWERLLVAAGDVLRENKCEYVGNETALDITLNEG